tara:strand:+ start:140 stop:322 length:183 start_codon:yes stop_codon:yes gene_type:complete
MKFGAPQLLRCCFLLTFVVGTHAGWFFGPTTSNESVLKVAMDGFFVLRINTFSMLRKVVM